MSQEHKFRLGVLVNPYAGIGGALALKGSDGAAIREKALAAGATPLANEKMKRAIKEFKDQSTPVEYVTVSDDMGQTLLEELGISPKIVYHKQAQQTESYDTENALDAMLNHGIDLLLFAGGDGTARNVFNRVGLSTAVLGVPAGCKIHSGVFAVTPSAAGKVIEKMLNGELVSQVDGEVRDIDEDAFRSGKVIAKHYGEMRVPHDLTYVQSVKMGGVEHDELVLQDMVDDVVETISDDDDYYYVMGSGSTVAAVMEALSLPNTLLGVDVVFQSSVVACDVTASYLETLVTTHPNKVRLVVTVIGGQGHVFGRGNQQLSPKVLQSLNKQNMLIMASKSKLNGLAGRPLLADTGDESTDALLRGPTTIITGFKDRVLYPME